MEIKKTFSQEEEERTKLKEKISELLKNETSETEDILMKEALKLVIVHNIASISFLQRRLGIGFSRAGKLIDDMEKANFVSSPDGSKPRKVFITREDYEKKYGETLPYEEVLFSDEILDKENFLKKTREQSNKDLFKDALKYVILSNKVNASSLQRRFGIGFFHACEIIAEMEKLNYISLRDENKNREIYITMEEYLEKYGENNEIN